jgi:ABC-type nitrate/sulfonate/bicarbonate transport system ATPase subunit
VLANVEVGLGRERGQPDALAQARRALEAVGLVDRAQDRPAVLSGGQKQRVSMAPQISPLMAPENSPVGGFGDQPYA